ncbi:Putative ribonuclease H protein At1g65750, partial [Linum perenne]
MCRLYWGTLGFGLVVGGRQGELAVPGLGEWDVEHIEMMFNERDATLILSMPPPDPRRRDRLVWHFSRNGCYTVRSAYRVVMERVRNQGVLHVGGDWTSLWKLRLPPKIKQFGWRLGRGAVLTRTMLNLRGIHVMQDCGCCAGSTESYWHLFVTCPVAVECWQKANLADFMARSTAGKATVVEWLLSITSGESEEVVQKGTGAVVQYRVLSWAGRWDSTEAEGRAMLEALSWVEQQGWRRVAFETDAQTVAHALHARGEDWTEFGELMRSCCAVLDRNPDFKVSFVGRGCNGVAHALARSSRFCVVPSVGTHRPGWIDGSTFDF